MTAKTQEVRRPIRLMFGIGNNMNQGFSVVYEAANGLAEEMNVWFDDPKFSLVRFVNAPEESCVVWDATLKTTKSFFGKEKTTWKWRLKEIRIRKDAQLPVVLPAK